MNTIGKLAACALIACMSPLAAAQKWTWEAGKQTSNGQITVKSLSGSTTYSGTQNPTGAVVKTNQNAVTQPPTVIIQATGGGGGTCLGMTRAQRNGNLGGIGGADAYCAAEFGSGWRFASMLDIVGCAGGIGLYNTPPAWVNGVAVGVNSCGNWSDSSGGNDGAALVGDVTGTFYRIGPQNRSCNSTYSLVCVKF